MAPSVQRYFQQGLAPSTQKTYGAAMKRFHNFCVRFAILNPFPVSEMLLCSFAAFLADEGLAPQTGKAYLSAVRSMQISLGLPDPREKSALPALKRVQAGISRVRMLKGAKSRIRLPITPALLDRMRRWLDSSAHPDKIVLWAIACTAFFGFFRLGELLPSSAREFDLRTGLAWGDVAVDNLSEPRMVRVHLKKSKCDQFGGGVDIVLGRTGSPLCPVAAILGFIAVRGVRPGAFFLDPKYGVITKSWFTEQIRSVLSALGLPQQGYAGHSFRIGAATTAALAGIEDSTIQALGRWHSSAFLQYIRMPRESLAGVSAMLVRTATRVN